MFNNIKGSNKHLHVENTNRKGKKTVTISKFQSNPSSREKTYIQHIPIHR